MNIITKFAQQNKLKDMRYLFASILLLACQATYAQIIFSTDSVRCITIYDIDPGVCDGTLSAEDADFIFDEGPAVIVYGKLRNNADSCVILDVHDLYFDWLHYGMGPRNMEIFFSYYYLGRKYEFEQMPYAGGILGEGIPLVTSIRYPKTCFSYLKPGEEIKTFFSTHLFPAETSISKLEQGVTKRKETNPDGVEYYNWDRDYDFMTKEGKRLAMLVKGIIPSLKLSFKITDRLPNKQYVLDERGDLVIYNKASDVVESRH